MAYREPGVYSTLINSRPLTGSTPTLVPVIIGEGPKFQDHEAVAVVRASTGLADTLPATKVTAISRIYTLSGGVETVIAAAANYALTSPNIVTWETLGPAKPANGTTYYIDYEARPEAIQYLPAYIDSFDALSTAYYGQIMRATTGAADTALNPVYLGAYLALESGAPGVYVIQIEPAEKTTYAVVVDTDIIPALAQAATLADGYFIVPMTASTAAVGLAITHCTTMSTTIERMERVCFVSKDFAVPAAASGIFSSAEIDAVIAKVDTIADKRVRVPFVVHATKTLSDGVEYSLHAEYVCAALAGLAAAIPASRALTRQSLFNFTTFSNVFSLTRGFKNSVAEAGIIVFEQPGGSGSNIVIRHGLTTNMTNVADKEHSIVTSIDYTAKYVRSVLEGYIGKFNIDGFLISKINGSLLAIKNNLVQNSILRDLKSLVVMQDADNPDSLLVTISALPLYPCNYIDVDILIE